MSKITTLLVENVAKEIRLPCRANERGHFKETRLIELSERFKFCFVSSEVGCLKVLNVGGVGGGAADWAAHFMANPGAHQRAFDAVLKAARAIDVKHGTNVVQYIWRSIIEGKFTVYP